MKKFHELSKDSRGRRDKEKADNLPEYPYLETSSNELFINRKHGEWRISPVISNNFTVRKETHSKLLLLGMLKYYFEMNNRKNTCMFSMDKKSMSHLHAVPSELQDD